MFLDLGTVIGELWSDLSGRKLCQVGSAENFLAHHYWALVLGGWSARFKMCSVDDCDRGVLQVDDLEE